MAFWAIIAEILEMITTVRKYIALAETIGSGHFVEELIHSHIAGAVTDALIAAGVPAETFDYLYQAREHLDLILNEVGLELTSKGLTVDGDVVLNKIAARLKGDRGGNSDRKWLQRCS